MGRLQRYDSIVQQERVDSTRDRIENVDQAGKIKDDLERSLGRYLTLSQVAACYPFLLLWHEIKSKTLLLVLIHSHEIHTYLITINSSYQRIRSDPNFIFVFEQKV